MGILSSPAHGEFRAAPPKSGGKGEGCAGQWGVIWGLRDMGVEGCLG